MHKATVSEFEALGSILTLSIPTIYNWTWQNSLPNLMPILQQRFPCYQPITGGTLKPTLAPKECCNVAMQFLWSILMKLQRISCKAKMIESTLLRTSRKCPQTPQWKFSILLMDVFPLKKIITLSKTTHVDHRPSALVLTKQLVWDVGCFEGCRRYLADCPLGRKANHLVGSWQQWSTTVSQKNNAKQTL